MRIGAGVFSANKGVGLVASENTPAVESLMKWRRVVFIF